MEENKMLCLTVVLVYHHKEDKILMCYRMNDPYKGLYNFVGGKMEPGEDGLAGAYRELFEETGISKEQINLTHFMDFVYPLDPCVVKAYAGRLREEPVLVEEKHPLHWMKLDENFFDMTKFAGEGNIGHLLEIVKNFSSEIFGGDS